MYLEWAYLVLDFIFHLQKGIFKVLYLRICFILSLYLSSHSSVMDTGMYMSYVVCKEQVNRIVLGMPAGFSLHWAEIQRTHNSCQICWWCCSKREEKLAPFPQESVFKEYSDQHHHHWEQNQPGSSYSRLCSCVTHAPPFYITHPQHLLLRVISSLSAGMMGPAGDSHNRIYVVVMWYTK